MRERNVRGPLPWWRGPLPQVLSLDTESDIRHRLDELSDGYAQRFYHSYAIWLPLPPSVNAAYKDVPMQRGRRIFCRRADSEDKKKWVADAHKRLDMHGFPRAGERTKDHFSTQFTIALSTWRRDINNATKVLLDVLTERLGLDDRYEVTELVQRLPVQTADQEGVLARVNIFRE